MEAHDAKAGTTQENESHVHADDCAGARGTDFDAGSKCHHLVNYQRQSSIEYDEIVASCVGYTLCCPCEIPTEPVHHGDIVQIISSWSTKNDGVILVHNNTVSATGVINQDDKTEPGKAYFLCVGVENKKIMALIPCQPLEFDSTNIGQADNILTVHKENNVYVVKERNKNSNDPVTGWAFERATEGSACTKCSISRDWRLCVDWKPPDSKSKSEKLYLAASRTGDLYLCPDDIYIDDDSVSTPQGSSPNPQECSPNANDSVRNPQTYFYLYKKLHVTHVELPRLKDAR